MVEDGGFGRPGRAAVMVRSDGVDELGAEGGVEPAGVLLDEPDAEVDVAEQATLGGGCEPGRGAELDRSPCVVDERRGEEKVGAQARVELRDLAADRRHADRVLEQPARVRVVGVGGRGVRAKLGRAEHPLDHDAKRSVRDLGDEELEEALELVCVAAKRGREAGRVGLRRRLDRADGELEAVAEALDPSEHAHRVALGEAAVEELDVLPHACVDAAARIDELEGEVRRATLRAQPLLARDAEHALDHPVFGELDDRGHAAILVGSAAVEEWLETCRAAAEDVRAVLAELKGRAAREPVVGEGEGGDDTTAIDAAAEAAIVRRLEQTGEDFLLVSEELGERRFGGGGPRRVVVDPIDGSLNAKRGLPHFCLSIAVADGDTMADVELAYLYDFGSGEEWTAQRGHGAQLDGRPLGPDLPKDEIETLAFEATLTSLVAEHAAGVVGLAHRLRIMGSLALALCNLAAGRLDGVCSLKPARAVDIAAAQLLVRERGLAIELVEAPPFLAAPLDVEARSRVVAAGTPELCRKLAAALSA